jgi:hypothetical protein
MSLTMNEINLEKSFETLKKMLKVAADKVKEGDPTSYAYAYGLLSGSVKGHLVGCTGIDSKELQEFVDGKDKDANDLREVNI